MRKTVLVLVPVLVLALAGATAFGAAKKPNPKNKAKLGTQQLKGDQAEIGTTYTLGKTDPINITLDKAEYTVDLVRYGNGFVAPNADEKLLVLHYTLHNPNPRLKGLAWSTLEITAVDANDTNWRYAATVGMEATGETCHMDLKPGQKTKVYTSIIVPAKGEIPKVMFQSRDKLVLRYDLRGKVKPLPAPIADPADPTGATALAAVPAQMGEYYPLRGLSAKIESAAFSDQPVKNRAPKKGSRYLVIIGSAKNNGPAKFGFAWSTVRPVLTDADGGQVRWNDDTLFAGKDETARGDIQPGAELRFRYVYEVPSSLGLKSLAITQASSRSYVYDLTQLK